jgi:probable rRNA maturation factor
MKRGGILEIVQAHPSLRLPRTHLRQLIHTVLRAEGVRLGYLSVVLADHATVRALNQTYLAHDYDTDVLSFSFNETPEFIEGEIYVDLDTAAERHAEFGASFLQEACRYVVHGLLHLIGYDDATPKAKAHMHALEDHYLASCQIT